MHPFCWIWKCNHHTNDSEALKEIVLHNGLEKDRWPSLCGPKGHIWIAWSSTCSSCGHLFWLRVIIDSLLRELLNYSAQNWWLPYLGISIASWLLMVHELDGLEILTWVGASQEQQSDGKLGRCWGRCPVNNEVWRSSKLSGRHWRKENIQSGRDDAREW